MTKIKIEGTNKIGHTSGFTYVDTEQFIKKAEKEVKTNTTGAKKTSDLPRINNPYYKTPQFFVGLLIIAILLGFAVYMNSAFPKQEKQKLTQTEYVDKLGKENADLQLQIGAIMTSQVQIGKDLQSKKKAYEESMNVYSGSVAKVVELEAKIQANKELMISQIVTE